LGRGVGYQLVRRLIPALLLAVVAIGVAEPLTSQPAGAATLLTITVSPTTASIAAGDTQQFTATGHYADLSTANVTDSVTWSSSLISYGTVSNTAGSQGLATGVATGATTITATDGLISGTAVLTVTPAVLVSISVSPTATSIAAGDTQQFTATGHYSNLSTTDLTDSVTWSSSLTSFGTVSNASGSQGLATGVATGATTITATDGLISGTAALTVTSATLVSISVSPTTASIAAGDTQQFTATGHYSNLSTTDLTDTVTWSSSLTSYGTVSNASGSQGLATGVATGATTITATDGLILGTAALTVTPAVLVSISVSPTTASLAAGYTQQFTATGHYSDLSTADLTDTVTWSSSLTSYGTVSNASGSQGLATGVANGATTITATDGLISGTAVLTVTPAVLVSITVSPTATSIAAGDTQQFAATGHYSDLSTQNLTSTAIWSSTLTSAATVSNTSGSQGLATGVGTGVTTIEATDPSSLIQGTAALTVTPAVLVSISVSPTTASVAAGDTQQFAATGHYSDLSTADLTSSVTWSSSLTSYGTVSNASGSQGLATGVADGATTITATDGLISGAAVLTVLPAVLVSITVSPTATSIAVGDTQQFTATGVYSDLSTADLTDSVTWSSSLMSYGTVSNTSGSQGLATGVADGATTITATDPSSLIQGTAVLTVLPAVLVGITVSPTTASVAAGDTQQFTATGVYSDLSTADLTDSVTWSSSLHSAATVSNASGSQGLATGVGPGATTVTATDLSSLIQGTAVLTVTPAVLESITLSPPTVSLGGGQTQKFTATGHYSDQSTQNLTNSVTWSSSDTTVAIISNTSGSQGLATGVGVGQAQIEATDPGTGIQGTAELTVAMLTITPSSGPSNAAVQVRGAEFPAGLTIKVRYAKENGRRWHLLCAVTVAPNGTFECSTAIENHTTIIRDQKLAGPTGPHVILATGRKWHHHSATTIFTLTAPAQTTEQSQPAVRSTAGKVRQPRLRIHARRTRRA
jgi:uncharacterized protein YjdB